MDRQPRTTRRHDPPPRPPALAAQRTLTRLSHNVIILTRTTAVIILTRTTAVILRRSRRTPAFVVAFAVVLAFLSVIPEAGSPASLLAGVQGNLPLSGWPIHRAALSRDEWGCNLLLVTTHQQIPTRRIHPRIRTLLETAPPSSSFSTISAQPIGLSCPPCPRTFLRPR